MGENIHQVLEKKQITWYRFIKHAVRLYGIVTPKKKEIRVSRMLAKFDLPWITLHFPGFSLSHLLG